MNKKKCSPVYLNVHIVGKLVLGGYLLRVIIVLAIVISIGILSGCSDEDSQSKGEFTVDNISSSEDFISGKTYFFVIPIQWSGDQTAVIESVKIQEDNTKIISGESITYEFFGGEPSKKSGVYQREDIGDKQDIEGYEIEDKGTLILEVNLMDAKKNTDRNMKVNYSVDGDEKEQMISTSTVEQLSTK